MGKYGGFFKGEQKKKKKGEGVRPPSFAPVFVPPEVIGKKKKAS